MGEAFAKGCSVSVLTTGAGAWFALHCGRARRESSLGTTGFHLCFLQMMLSCWLHQTRTFSMYWGGLQKRVAYPLRVGGEVLPQVEEFKYIGVLFTEVREIWRLRLTGGLVQPSAVMRVGVYWTVVGKKELS
ncbi:hypothetical protein L3Q82_010873 [Scortum barcoo]|uniref:Uncharacterized protein n=1 Tax=Scortum barcoo TaxID=214431 RepID=A0ACB8W7M5_9TELE|nr:hypothetical protein L3Q82_010873 [Scortum barcoo]